MGGDTMNPSWHNTIPYRRDVSSRGEESDAVNDNIEQAFLNVKSFPLKHIIFQSWRPGKTTAGKRVLRCWRNPCFLEPHNARLFKYRLLCCKYYYDLEPVPVDDPVTISGAPPSTVFLNHFPEVVLDLAIHRGTPLVDSALDCGLTCFLMLPVFYHSSCVAVIEVSMSLPRDLAVIYIELYYQLMAVGLCITPPKPPRPLKTITIADGKLVNSEIDKALDMAFQSHAISLAHVWMCYETRQHDMILTKIKWKSDGDQQLSFVEMFYNDILMFSVKKGEGLEDHPLHMCTNIHKFSGNKSLLAMLYANTKSKCTSFVICLRSSHVGELDFAFEFLWSQSRSHLASIKGLLSTLRENLPSFRFASGEQLGDELLVVDSGSGCPPFECTPKALEETKTTLGMERKPIDLSAGQSENFESEDDDEDLVILAIYKVDYKLFFLPVSASFEDVKEKLIQELELNPVGTYKIMYQVVPEEWNCLADGTCLKSCILSFQTSENVNHIKLGVLDVEK